MGESFLRTDIMPTFLNKAPSYSYVLNRYKEEGLVKYWMKCICLSKVLHSARISFLIVKITKERGKMELLAKQY